VLIAGKFKEQLFHPNVFPSGAVDLNYISQPQTHWKPSITVMEVNSIVFCLTRHLAAISLGRF